MIAVADGASILSHQLGHGGPERSRGLNKIPQTQSGGPGPCSLPRLTADFCPGHPGAGHAGPLGSAPTLRCQASTITCSTSSRPPVATPGPGGPMEGPPAARERPARAGGPSDRTSHWLENRLLSLRGWHTLFSFLRPNCSHHPGEVQTTEVTALRPHPPALPTPQPCSGIHSSLAPPSFPPPSSPLPRI